jgi:hypothetical protein
MSRKLQFVKVGAEKCQSTLRSIKADKLEAVKAHEANMASFALREHTIIQWMRAVESYAAGVRACRRAQQPRMELVVPRLTCRIKGCGQPVYLGGLCAKHAGEDK